MVHIDPGPIPTLIPSAPTSINSLVASAVTTLPAIICVSENSFLKTRIILSGQHVDMVYEIMKLFDIEVDIDLNIMKEKPRTKHSFKGKIRKFIKQVNVCNSRKGV